MNDETQEICANSDCEVATSGKCLEGFSDLEECPHYNKEAPSPSLPTVETQRTPPLGIDVASGNALNETEAELILCSRPATVVTVIGLSDAGKTTLISSLFDVLQKGPFAGYSFIASKTLPAFELRCHLSRAESKRNVPDTEHSPRGMGLVFLHLAITNNSEERVDLLVSDRTGEDYDSAINNKQACLGLIEVSRADLILVLVDGAKLSNLELRHSSVADTKRLIEALIDSEMIGNKHRIALVLTKYDKLVQGDQTNQDGIDAFNTLVEFVEQYMSANVNEIIAIKTAARPEKPGIDAGTGLESIFDECVKPPLIKTTQSPVRIEPKRAYHRHQMSTEG